MRPLAALAVAGWLLAAQPALAAPSPAAVLDAGERVVTVEGRGETDEQALKDAFRKAIEEVVGVLVSSESEVRNFAGVSDRIYAHSEGYVRRYELLDKYQDVGGVRVVMARVRVTQGAIADDLVALKVLQMELGNPKILAVAGDEGSQGGESSTFSRLALDRVNHYLGAKGFDYVDAAELEGPGPAVEAPSALERARAVAARAGADVFVTVSADLRETRQSGAYRFARASVRISAFEVATGRGLAADSGYSRELALRSGVESSKEAAIEEAVGDAIDRTMRLVVQRWKSDVAKGRPFRVAIRGLGSYAQQRAFTSVLEEVGRELKLDASGGGGASYTLWSREETATLIDRILAKGGKIKGLTLRKQDQGRLEFEIR
ncbi:MAG TPA: hypothetical protein V6D00_04785 [Pantanalinema sp.]